MKEIMEAYNKGYEDGQQNPSQIELEKVDLRSCINSTYNAMMLLHKGTHPAQILESIYGLKHFYDNATDEDWQSLASIKHPKQSKEYMVERTAIIYGDEAANFMEKHYDRFNTETGLA